MTEKKGSFWGVLPERWFWVGDKIWQMFRNRRNEDIPSSKLLPVWKSVRKPTAGSIISAALAANVQSDRKRNFCNLVLYECSVFRRDDLTRTESLNAEHSKRSLNAIPTDRRYCSTMFGLMKFTTRWSSAADWSSASRCMAESSESIPELDYLLI